MKKFLCAFLLCFNIVYGSHLPWAAACHNFGKFIFASPLVFSNIILLKGFPHLIPLTKLDDEARVALKPLLQKYGIVDTETIKIYSSHNPLLTMAGAFAFQDVRERGIIISHDFMSKDPAFVEAIIGHEVGHLMHNDVYKRSGIIHGSAALTGTIMYAIQKYVKTQHPLLTRLSRVEWVQYGRIFMPYYIATQSYSLISNAAFRAQEYAADDHLIKHARNPAVIKAFIAFLKNDYETKKSIYESFTYRNGFGTHPHPLKRIERLEAALQSVQDSEVPA